MMAIKTRAENWTSEFLLGQIGAMVVLEVETLPTYTHIVIHDETFTQRCVPGKFGESLTYAELNEIRTLLEELGDYGQAAGSVSELKLRKEITDIQLALVEGS